MTHAESQRKYQKTAKGKATAKRYAQSEKGRIRLLAAMFRRYHYGALGEKARARARRWYLQNRARKIQKMREYDARMRSVYGSKRMAFWGRQVKEAA